MAGKKIYIFALAAHGQGISGSDRIFIEFARRWSGKYPVTIFVWEEGYKMCQRQHLEILNIKYQISNMNLWKRMGFVVNYFARIFEGIRIGIILKIDDPKNTIAYSASEFWMDSLPAFILKLRYPKITWAAAWYQTAPKPWLGYGWAFPYWFVQLPIKPLISKFADFVLVNNEEEKKQFPKHAENGKAIVVLGAVDLEAIKKFKKIYPKPYVSEGKERSAYLLNPKKYDAVFQGRFHPQKGVLELIDIWKKVVAKIPNAKLAMIGDGPLMKSVKLKVQSAKLQKNIKLFGYMFDGPEKYRIFATSKLVVHPAFYDSGGMASAEAMTFGIPAVGFNLPAFKSYYPQGMIKVKIGDLEGFSGRIVELLGNTQKRILLGKQALQMVEKNWSWDKRAEDIIRRISK